MHLGIDEHVVYVELSMGELDRRWRIMIKVAHNLQSTWAIEAATLAWISQPRLYTMGTWTEGLIGAARSY